MVITLKLERLGTCRPGGDFEEHRGLLELWEIYKSFRSINSNYGEAGLLETQEIVEPCRLEHGVLTVAVEGTLA